MNGLDALVRMKAADPNVRCLIASGNIDHPRRLELSRLGASSIRKPYSAAQLLESLDQILGQPRT